MHTAHAAKVLLLVLVRTIGVLAVMPFVVMVYIVFASPWITWAWVGSIISGVICGLMYFANKKLSGPHSNQTKRHDTYGLTLLIFGSIAFLCFISFVAFMAMHL